MEDFKFAFLNAVYTNPGGDSIFEVAMATNTMQRQQYVRTDLAGLQQLAKKDGLSRDFYFEDGFLRCRNMQRMPASETVLKSFGKACRVKSNPDLQDMVFEWLEKECMFVIDEAIEKIGNETNYTGDGIVSCRRLQFASGTMSAYYPVVQDGFLSNKMLVTMQERELVAHPFYLAVPEGKSLVYTPHAAMRKVVLNNSQYTLIKVEALPLFGDIVFLETLINKCCAIHEVFCAIVAIMKRYVSCILEATGVCKEPAVWGGGSMGYASDYGVYLTSSIGRLSQKEIESCIYLLEHTLEDSYRQGGTKSLRENILQLKCSELCKRALLVIAPVLYRYGDPAERFEAMGCAIDTYDRVRVAFGAYLYGVRVQAYISNNMITYRTPMVLEGSDEHAKTFVREVLDFGN